ncbi:sulfatase [bacterium]|nr:sulfatase [candidate division CSSED10-310 bacterium]
MCEFKVYISSIILMLFGAIVTATAQDPQHLILVSIDTLRADHLGCYGNWEAYTPNIDTVARHGIMFRKAVVPCGRTNPSLASIMTAKYPNEHGVRSLSDKLGDSEITLAEILKNNGFTTVFVNGNTLVGPNSGFIQGFDIYRGPQGGYVLETTKNTAKNKKSKRKQYQNRRSAHHITEYVYSLFKSLAEPRHLFLWTHYMDPHWTYDPPSPFDRMCRATDMNAPPPELTERQLRFNPSLHAKYNEYFKAMYAGEVAYTDYHIGRLFRFLFDENVMIDSLLIVTSDHGESLGEKGFFYSHGDEVYRQSLNVPLIFWWSEQPETNQIIPDPVQTTDIRPTILQILAVSAPASLANRSLLPRNGTPCDRSQIRFMYAETGTWRQNADTEKPYSSYRGKSYMISNGLRKLIAKSGSGEFTYELFNLANDPGEKKNVIGVNLPQENKLKTMLSEWIVKSNKTGKTEASPVSPEMIQKLERLGYIR